MGRNSMDMGEDMARSAVVDRLAQICVAQFNQDPEKAKKLEALKKADYWKREQYAKDSGWATMPFEKEPDRRVAEKCSELIMKENQ